MADTVTEDEAGAAPTSSDFDNVDKTKKKGRFAAHKQSIIVIASVVGVLLAYLTYRKLVNGSQSAGVTATTPAGTSGAVAGTADAAGATQAADQQSAFAGFQTLLGNMSDELTTLEATVGQNTTDITTLQHSPSPISGPAPITAQQQAQKSLFGNVKSAVGAQITAYTQRNKGGVYSGKLEGANAVNSLLTPGMSIQQDQQTALGVLRNYQSQNKNGIYNQQILGAQAASAQINNIYNQQQAAKQKTK